MSVWISRQAAVDPKTWEDEVERAMRIIGNQVNGSEFTSNATACTLKTVSVWRCMNLGTAKRRLRKIVLNILLTNKPYTSIRKAQRDQLLQGH